jgi:opacity protein-like surface antigen
MPGRKAQLLGAALLASLFVPGIAGAADIIEPIYEPEPIPVVGASWYLRGDIGVSHQRVKNIDNALYDAPGVFDVDIRDKEFEPAFFAGVGIGYKINDMFRVDVTGEYRFKSEFHGLDRINNGATINDFDTDKSEVTLLANAYWDIVNWNGIVPFIGAGVGASYNKIHDLDDRNLADPFGGGGSAGSNGEWHFAWALHAGVGFEITKNLTLEVAYRYLHLGDAESGDIVGDDGTNLIDNPLEFKDLASHDVKVGLRYLFW